MITNNVICSRCCSALVRMEVSVGTHRVRVEIKDPGCRAFPIRDGNGLWVEALCADCNTPDPAIPDVPP